MLVFFTLFPLFRFFSFFLHKTVIFLTDWKFLRLTNLSFNWQYTVLRWPGPIYMRIGYVLNRVFRQVSMIFGIVNKKWWNFKKMLFIFL